MLSRRYHSLFITRFWEDQDEGIVFSIRAYVNPESQEMIGIAFFWNLSSIENITTTMAPQVLLQEFGVPDEFLVDVSPFVGDEESFALVDAVFHVQ